MIENKSQILSTAIQLIQAWKNGQLGGEIMPEDANPNYDQASPENFLYFTLPMALNYQRNSYKLWEAAQQTAFDPETADIFIPEKVVRMFEQTLREKMLKYKLALQPNRHIAIWQRLCQTFTQDFAGDVRNLFSENNNDVQQIKAYILQHKKDFPYLSGTKIINYWLYVMENYTNLELTNRQFITVAPDTHVVKASFHLGLISQAEFQSANVQNIVAQRWQELFDGTDYLPIDIHTPLWLWSRLDFKELR